jgi:RNA:NAD 2'-phosphotransferase (TPT1/KptA family)
MGRKHIHFSAHPMGSARVISGMRRDCEVLIHVDVAKAMQESGVVDTRAFAWVD